MRHRIFGKKLGRNHNQRQALLRNLTKSFLTYGFISTTSAKAKAVSPTINHLCAKIINQPEETAKRELVKIFQSLSRVNFIYSAVKSVYTGSSTFLKQTSIKRRQGDDALIVKLSFTKPVSLTPPPPVKSQKTIVKQKKEIKPVPKKKEKN